MDLFTKNLLSLKIQELSYSSSQQFVLSGPRKNSYRWSFPINIFMRDILLPIYTVILSKALAIFHEEIIHYERKISTWKPKNNNKKSTQY